MEKNIKRISKFLSLILRHRPEAIGLHLDDNGWANVEDLLSKMNIAGTTIDRSLLDEVVQTNEKKRFTFDDTGNLIRASQGHSVEVDLQLPEAVPPALLFHGTNEEAVSSILASGIARQQRHHVHLCDEKDTARAVGSRKGKVVLLYINAEKMHQDGFKFYLSANGVWLADEVPASYISLQSK